MSTQLPQSAAPESGTSAAADPPRIKITRLPPAPDREELHYSNYTFDSGLRTAREARVADVDTIPKRYRIESVRDRTISAIYDQPSSRLFTAQRKGKAWTRYATAATLRRLPERSRRVLMMFYWEGRTAEEIAAEFNCRITYTPDGKVWNNHAWVILHRARKELLAMMEKEERDGSSAEAAVSAEGADTGERRACGRQDNRL